MFLYYTRRLMRRVGGVHCGDTGAMKAEGQARLEPQPWDPRDRAGQEQPVGARCPVTPGDGMISGYDYDYDYIYIYTYIYIYICIYICVCMCIYIYIYIYILLHPSPLKFS